MEERPAESVEQKAKRCWYECHHDFDQPREGKTLDDSDSETASTCSLTETSSDFEDDFTPLPFERPKKRVRIELSNNTAVAAPWWGLSETETDAVWWTKHELSHLKRKGYAQAAVTASATAPDLHQVYSAAQAAANNNNATTAAPEAAKQSTGMSACAPALFRLGCSNTRGLESIAYPQRSRDRQAAVRTLLHAQRKMPSHITTLEQRDEYLAAVSCHYSQRAKIFAKVMASADAAIARKLH